MIEQDSETEGDESSSDDELLETQEGKGYGEDEGERDASLEDE